MADGRSGGYLTLVDTRVLALGVAYLERPLLGVGRVHRLEALIARVGVAADRQQVNVAMPHPGHLRQAKETRLCARSYRPLYLSHASVGRSFVRSLVRLQAAGARARRPLVGSKEFRDKNCCRGSGGTLIAASADANLSLGRVCSVF